MSQIQQGRAKAKRTFRRPKDFKKAEDQANSVFNDRNTTAEATRAAAPRYSRVTHRIVAKRYKH